ncbi:MAG: molybdopterin molybdotransferase MoeA [Chloroflexi bacterium]|nr:molybdopterin molybdotransferase MoeA [Chloroflexota bacterium]
MISVEEALETVLGHFDPLDAERRPILDALGQVLAEDVISSASIPPFDNSAMDGYAVQSGDVAGAGRDKPIELRVIADLAAGRVAGVSVGPGTAVRIMTGAPLPNGADAVVRFEDTDEASAPSTREGGRIGVMVPVVSGENVRYAGEDVRTGELVIPKGATVRPSEIGVLASLGRKDVLVHRRPKVAVLATGDELVEIDEPVSPGKIRNSNSYSVASLVARYGGVPVMLGIARDRIEELTAKLAEGLTTDLVITSGGVSVGDYDMVKNVLKAEGKIDFWQVRMKPGKPLAFGHIRGVPLLGLPGNPVSAMVSFEQFGRPAILKMLGKTKLAKPTVSATLTEDVENYSGRRHYIRAILEKRDGRYYAWTTGEQGSGILTSMAKANGLVVIPEDQKLVKAGTEVMVQMLDWSEEQA